MMNKYLIISLSLFCLHATANESCSRIAVINDQEILVDPSLNQKGEGLRFHLEKDQGAKRLLEMYQNQSSNKIRPAVIGSVGSLLLLSSFITNTSDNNRKALFIGGLSTLFINFLVTKTIENNNEKYLIESIQEYNKRRSPKIYLKTNEGEVIDPKFYLEKTWSF